MAAIDGSAFAAQSIDLPARSPLSGAKQPRLSLRGPQIVS